MSVTINGSGQLPVQVIQTVKTDTFTTTSTSYADITGLSVTITPTNSANKILVFAQLNGSAADHSGFQLVRGTTPLYLGDASGSRSRGSAANFYHGSNSVQIRNATIMFVDSPNTTASTTYKIQGFTRGSALCVNRSANDDDASYAFRVPCSITVMEISG